MIRWCWYCAGSVAMQLCGGVGRWWFCYGVALVVRMRLDGCNVGVECVAMRLWVVEGRC